MEEITGTARREDVESINGIVKALYASISGPAGPRDWDRLRSLYLPGARMIPVREREGGAAPEVFEIDGYIASRAPFFDKNPLHEVEVDRRSERFGRIAQVWSGYDGFRNLDEAPCFRGANSLQLLHDGERWWIVSLICFNEMLA